MTRRSSIPAIAIGAIEMLPVSVVLMTTPLPAWQGMDGRIGQ